MIYINSMVLQCRVGSGNKLNCFDSIKYLEPVTIQMEVFILKLIDLSERSEILMLKSIEFLKVLWQWLIHFNIYALVLLCCLRLIWHVSKMAWIFRSCHYFVLQAVWCLCNDRHFTVLMMNDCNGIEPDPFCILRKQDNYWMVKAYRPVTITIIR